MDLLTEIYYYLSIPETEEMARATSDFEEDSRTIFNEPLYWINRFYDRFGREPNYTNPSYSRKLLLFFNGRDNVRSTKEIAEFYSSYPQNSDIDQDLYEFCFGSNAVDLIIENGIIHIDSLIKLQSEKRLDDNWMMSEKKSINLASQFQNEKQLTDFLFVSAHQGNKSMEIMLREYAFVTLNTNIEVRIPAYDSNLFLTYATPEVYQLRQPTSDALLKIALRVGGYKKVEINTPLLKYLMKEKPKLLTKIRTRFAINLRQKLLFKDVLNDNAKDITKEEIVLSFGDEDSYKDNTIRNAIKWLSDPDEDYDFDIESLLEESPQKANFRKFILQEPNLFRTLFPDKIQDILLHASEDDDFELYDAFSSGSLEELIRGLYSEFSDEFFEHIAKKVKLEKQSKPNSTLTIRLTATSESKIKTFLSMKYSRSYIAFLTMGNTSALHIQGVLAICQNIPNITSDELFEVLSELMGRSMIPEKIRQDKDFEKEFLSIVDSLLNLYSGKKHKKELIAIATKTKLPALIKIVKSHF